MINVAAYKETFQAIRKVELAGWNPEEESIYSFYRWFVQDAVALGKVKIVEKNPSDDLRGSLEVASRAAQQFGATPNQINFIVALAEKSGRFDVMSGGRLTSREASRIIDVMKGY